MEFKHSYRRPHEPALDMICRAAAMTAVVWDEKISAADSATPVEASASTLKRWPGSASEMPSRRPGMTDIGFAAEHRLPAKGVSLFFWPAATFCSFLDCYAAFAVAAS